MNTAFEAPVKKPETDFHKCSSCGGEVFFDPEIQALHCQYCGGKHQIELQPTAIHEYDYDTAHDTANLDWGTESRVIHCNSCGADTVIDGNVKSQACAFCGSDHVIKHEEGSGIAPESLVPFQISKKSALEQFTKWIRSRFFAPRALKENYRKDNLKGVYIPSWTYDADSASNYTAQAGTYYYVNETRMVKNSKGKMERRTVRVRKIRWRPVSGRYNLHFNDHLVNASGSMNESLLKGLQPFDLNGLVPYSPEFLAGYLAERYSVGLKAGWDRASKEMDRILHQQITRHIRADQVRMLSVNTQYSSIKYKHLLLPLWISAYTFKGKTYQFMVNGQTGKVKGHAPVSVWKVAALVVGIAAVAAVLIYYFA